MSSAVNGLGSVNPLNLIDLPESTAPPAATVSTPQSGGVSAAQELGAMEKNGSLDSLLSASVAVGVLQIADPTSVSPNAGTDVSNLVNQLISAYSTPTEQQSSNQGTAASLSNNPALAIIQAMEADGAFGPSLMGSSGTLG